MPFNSPAFYRTTKARETIEVKETLLLRICAVHRLPVDWNYDEYKVSFQVYHGTRPIGEFCPQEGACEIPVPK